MASNRRPLLKRIGTLALIVVAVVFAVQGGEFGTLDLFRQRQQKARISRSVDSLSRIVDSLKAYKDKVEHDPATQERIAREVFGMVRGNKEIVYRFAGPSPDSARRAR
ncbi:MAG TPA: septum formation initiator family protein [Gemmatimonadaceae bacterium]